METARFRPGRYSDNNYGPAGICAGKQQGFQSDQPAGKTARRGRRQLSGASLGRNFAWRGSNIIARTLKNTNVMTVNEFPGMVFF